MTEPPVEILLVQRDHPQIQLTLDVVQSNHLANRIHVVRDGAEALEFLFRSGAYADRQAVDPRLVLYHLRLADGADLDVLKRITQDPRTATIPVTVLACSRDDRLAAVSELREHGLHLPVVVIARPTPKDTVRALASLAGTGVGNEPPRLDGRRAAAPAFPPTPHLQRDLDALVRLTHGAAHEFNNLFSVFIAYTELLLKDLDLDDPRRAGAEEIFKSIGRACRLTQQMLSFKAGAAGPPGSEPGAPPAGGGVRLRA
jgi:two-component system response regulator